MKYFPLVWAALWRKRPRTILTMLSIIACFLLFGLGKGFTQAFNAGVEVAGADRLVTVSKYSLTQILPYAFLQQIKGVKGVKAVTFASWFGGVYQDEKNFFAQFPVEAKSYLEMYPEIQMPQEQKQKFLDTRSGAIVARTLADRFHWKIGDKIPIQATIWPAKDGNNTWTFDLVGIFDNPDPAVRGQIEMMLFNHEYFEENKQFAKGMVGWYIEQSDNPSNNATIAHSIDDLFRNSPNPVRTDSEKACNQSFIKQMGDIGFLVNSILSAVFFMLLFITGNTMMQSVRERIPELAVLKTIGFSGRAVLALVLAEAIALCLIAGIAGLMLASGILPGIAAHVPGFAGMEMRSSAWVIGIGLTLVLALIVGLPPALRAMRLDIVNALGGH
jgi:putative ABC transport system permease protein